MTSPICDFVQNYIKSDSSRLHMPGHKGRGDLGFEEYDITEIDGADELFHPSCIIAESEKNASDIFGSHTVYSAGGSTLCIQTMLHLIAQYARSKGKIPKILAARNAHKAFVNAAALLGIEIKWMFPSNSSYHCFNLAPNRVEELIKAHKPTAVYITSPDYLGNLCDIRGISEVCKRHNTLLAVDNAHGAYLKFLPTSLHPIDLGADICCDSAHKTLPVLTGGAYLHISDTTPELFHKNVKASMSLFGSSSPSYLILQSLDMANANHSEYQTSLNDFLPIAAQLKRDIQDLGYTIIGDEPLKITLCPKPRGFDGSELAQLLMKHNIFPEFYDNDFVVLMLSPSNTQAELNKLKSALEAIPRLSPILTSPPSAPVPNAAISPSRAIACESEDLPIDKCLGKICAAPTVSCPPAIPIIVSGERIDEAVIDCFKYYGFTHCSVIK